VEVRPVQCQSRWTFGIAGARPKLEHALLDLYNLEQRIAFAGYLTEGLGEIVTQWRVLLPLIAKLEVASDVVDASHYRNHRLADSKSHFNRHALPLADISKPPDLRQDGHGDPLSKGGPANVVEKTHACILVGYLAHDRS
jgi:hypothetical protein